MTSELKKIPIYAGSNFEVWYPDIQFFIDKINNQEYFSFIRHQYDFWSQIVKPIHACLKGDNSGINSCAKKVYANWERTQNSRNYYATSKKKRILLYYQCSISFS